MMVKLSEQEALKIYQGINKEHFKQAIESKQESNMSNVWQWIISGLLVILSVGTVVVLIVQGLPK